MSSEILYKSAIYCGPYLVYYYTTYLEALEDTLALRGLEELLFLFLRRLITLGLEVIRGAMKLIR